MAMTQSAYQGSSSTTTTTTTTGRGGRGSNVVVGGPSSMREQAMPDLATTVCCDVIFPVRKGPCRVALYNFASRGGGSCSL